MKKYINKEENKHLKFNVGVIPIAQNSIENNKKTVGTRNLESARAITLISLVITIILLILLAGVVINLGLGENGIFNKVKQAKEQYSESIAKEKLEMVLLDVIAEKGTNSEYNNGQFLDDMLKANGIEVQGDNVIIDNYIFTLDRDNLGILKSLGQAQIKVTKEVQKYLGKNANDKYEAQLLVIIESNNTLQKIEITNPDGTTFELETDKEKIAKDITVEFDEEYKLEITDKTGKKETRTIVERSHVGIRTAGELAEFRDKVNTGLTYEGKIINLLKDIDLSSVCGEDVNGQEVNWQPIGNYYVNENDYIVFKGTFDGQYNTISNLYININENNIENYENDNGLYAYNYFGLFGNNFGKIENLIMKNVYIYVDMSNYSKRCVNYLGAIAGYGEEKAEFTNIGIESGIVTSICTLSSEEYKKRQYVGGIVGAGDVIRIYNSYNKANISSISNNTNYYHANYIGGIIGAAGTVENVSSNAIDNCYNAGKININNGYDVCGGGIVGLITNMILKNSYNYGKISCEGLYYRDFIGGIAGVKGKIDNSKITATILNSYCTTTSSTYSYYENSKSNPKTNGRIQEEILKGYKSQLSEEFIDDIKNSDGTYKYNNGYPILKWQLPQNR